MSKLKQLKALYLCADPGIPVWGTKGASIHIRSLVTAFQKLGCQMQVVTTNKDEEIISHAPFPVLKPSPDKITKTLLKNWRELELNQNLTKEVGYVLQNSVLERMLLKLYYKERFDFIYERYSLWSMAGAKVAAKLKIPFLLEVNSPLVEEQKEFRSLDLVSLALAIQKLNFDLADKIIAVSEDVKEYITDKGVPAKKVVVLPNAVDPQIFNPKTSNGQHQKMLSFLPQDHFVIGFVGSLKPWHGVKILVEAFKKLLHKDKTYHLLIVGEGPERKYLEQIQTKRNLNGSVTLVGSVEHDQIPGLLRKMDVAVAPYPVLGHFYFSPIKLFEYMAVGRPVIASACGQIKSIIKHRRDGFLVPAGDSIKLAKAIETLRKNPRLAELMGKQASQKIRRKFTWEKNALKILDLVPKISNNK